MACNQEILLLLSRYANGEATADEAARSSVHVATCTECRELLEDWQSQRQLLVWASTLELPELSPNTLREIAQTEEPMSVPPQTPLRLAWPRVRINRTMRSSAMGAVVTLGLAYLYASSNYLFIPRLPDGTTLGCAAPRVRVRNGVVLELAPNSRVTRLRDDGIRLDDGWLRATVRHGSGLRIQTKRLEVSDIGTVFQVNAGPSSDSVTVEAGEVSVSRGGKTYPLRSLQNLVASDKGIPSIENFPAYSPEEAKEGQPLSSPNETFYPQSEDSLDWREGQKRLASAFAGAKSNGSGAQSIVWPNGTGAIRFHATMAQGTRMELRAHFADIARSQSGASNSQGIWAFPVAYMMLDNVAVPQGLSEDVYEVRMVSDGSRLQWRFTGSKGQVVDTPVRFERRPAFRTGTNGSSTTSAGRFEHFLKETDHGAATAAIRFMDWPGTKKPTLRLELKPLNGYGAQARAMEADLARRTAGVTGLALGRGDADLLYLDPGRQHRLMFAWNADAGRQVSALSGRTAQGRGDSALMGVLSTDSPLILPHLPAGAYLLRWIAPSSGGASHWEIETLNGKATMTVPSDADHWKGLDVHGLTATSSRSLSGSGVSCPLAVETGTGTASNGAYSFRFTLRDDTKNLRPLGNGWIQVKRP